MMDLQKRIFLIVGIVAAVVLIMLLLYFGFRGPGDDALPVPTTPTVDVGPVVLQQDIVRTVIEENTPEITMPTGTPPDEQIMKQTAITFVERFASYSSQGDNTHLDDAAALATDKMAAWIKTQTVSPSGVFAGIKTVVVASSIVSKTNEKGSVAVSVQQTIESQTESNVVYKTGRIDLLASGGEWKVDALYWE